MKKILFLFLFSYSLPFFAQDTLNLNLSFNFFDYPYLDFAAKTVSNSSFPNFKTNGTDYLIAFRNPSMFQSLEISASYYNSLNYFLSKMRIHFFNNNFLNYFTQSLVYSGAILISEYIPFGDSWLHEEFHRAVLTKNFVDSYNQVYDFPLFSSLVSVNNVSDADLIRFKSSNPQDFIRLDAAGIEGEYLLAKRFQFYNFFYNQPYPYFSYEMLWALNSFYYVWMCHTDEAEQTTNQVNEQEGANVKIRDFTGLDFTAWVYDLFKPNEPYQSRGIHPSGVGINRYVKPSDLNSVELNYLKDQAYLQLLNLLSPFIIGIKHFSFNIHNQIFYFNFAFRHLLTSFGNDISLDIFLKKDFLNILFAPHFYSNHNHIFPGEELNLVDYPINFGKMNLYATCRQMLWLQPQNLFFDDEKAKLGGMFSITLKLGKKNFYPYLRLRYKTGGWLAGDVFQTKNFSIQMGLNWRFRK
jgi:hypothetical protein